jgi:hypothetical protein
MTSPAIAVIPDAQVVTDLQIEQWVREHFGFVPHPFWITHCNKPGSRCNPNSGSRHPYRDFSSPAGENECFHHSFRHAPED